MGILQYSYAPCLLPRASGSANVWSIGLNSAYLGLRLADMLNLPSEEREAIYYGALLKDVGCTACSAGFSAFFPDDELLPRSDFWLVDPTRLTDIIAWISRSVPVDSPAPQPHPQTPILPGPVWTGRKGRDAGPL